MGPSPGNLQAKNFIYMALRKCGQMRPGYPPSPELLADALSEWYTWFDELGAERNSHYSNPVYQYSVAGPGSQTGGNGYTIGPSGADWIGPRPESIIRANLVFTTIGPQPVYIPLKPLNQTQWASLAIQQIPATSVTSVFWYDPQYPNGVFNVFPPLNGNAIQIYQWGVLVPPVALTTNYLAPPGYGAMVIKGLAARLYHMVTKEAVIHLKPFAIVAAEAETALNKVRRVNRPTPQLANDFHSRRGIGDGFYDSNVTNSGTPY